MVVFAWNRRQVFRHMFPGYPADVKAFVFL